MQCQEDLRVLSDLDFLFQSRLTYQQEAIELLINTPTQILETTLRYIKELPDFSSDSIEKVIWQAGDEFNVNHKDMAGLIRLAITGAKVSPDLFGIMSLLGKETVIILINPAFVIQSLTPHSYLINAK